MRHTTPPAWLTARPIAHRGLHNARAAIVENSLAAAAAAIERDYAIECDIQRTCDGEAVVHHDWTLDRLTNASGRLDALTAAECRALEYKGAAGRLASFADFLTLVGGRVPVVCEIKSRFDGDTRLAARAFEVAAAYEGPLAFKSFDPTVIAVLRHAPRVAGCAALPLGVVAQAAYDHDEWIDLPGETRLLLTQFLHIGETRPDFVSYRAEDLPHAVPHICRTGMGLPVMTWTVRSRAQADVARRHADQIVFEGFQP